MVNISEISVICVILWKRFGGFFMVESQNIEWKESWRDEYVKWICGFSNAQGGKIYIGTDDNGKVVGVGESTSLRKHWKSNA